MKKITAALLVVLLMVMAVACGTPAQQNLSMITGGESGTYYAYGGMIAKAISDKVEGVSITASTSGASAANVRALNKGEADLAFIQNDVMKYAYDGIEILKDDGQLQNIATVGTLYPEVIQLVATESSGIQTVADLKGKRVCVGDLGSGTEANARQILEAYGLTYDDFAKVEYLSFEGSSTAMQQMTIDAAFVTAGVPNPAILQLNALIAVKLIPVDGAEAEALFAKYPFYTAYTITDTDYEGLGGATTVAVLATLACRKDLDEDTVYKITKALFESKDTIGHDKAKLLSAENAVQGISVPLHPGAEKYYKEVGLK